MSWEDLTSGFSPSTEAELVALDFGDVQSLPDLDQPRTEPAAVALSDGRILIAGGTLSATGREVDILNHSFISFIAPLGPSPAPILSSLDSNNPFLGAASRFQAPVQCTDGVAMIGNDRVYRVALEAGQKPTFRATPSVGDLDIALYLIQDPTQAHGNYCYAGSNRAGAGSTESIEDFFAPRDDTYYLVVDTAQTGRTDAVDLSFDILEHYGPVREYRDENRVAVPDGGGVPGEVTGSILVPSLIIADITIEVEVSHSFRGDVELLLTPPGGGEFLLQAANGGAAESCLSTLWDGYESRSSKPHRQQCGRLVDPQST